MTVIWSMVYVVWRARTHGVKEPLMAFGAREPAEAWMQRQPKAEQFESPTGFRFSLEWHYGIVTLPAQGIGATA